MSQKRIKVKKQGPLDWIRTDDRSMVECFYILLLTRGLPSVLNSFQEALRIEADASRNEKAQFNPSWTREADFCDDVIARLYAMGESLKENWAHEDPMMGRVKNPVVGAFYPLPGGGVYIPKK
jgi:hypothetical protein